MYRTFVKVWDADKANPTPIGSISQYYAMAWSKHLKRMGAISIAVREDDPILSVLVTDCILELLLMPTSVSISGVDPVLKTVIEGQFMYRQKQRVEDSNGRVYYKLLGEALGPSIAARHIVAWPAGRTNRSQWTAKYPTEIAENIVYYNMNTTFQGGYALASLGRLRDADPRIETYYNGSPTATGTQIDYSAYGKNVLACLFELASNGNHYLFWEIAAGSDYTQLYIGLTQTFTHLDRTKTVVFSQALGNAVESTHTNRDNGETTVAIVGGQGTQSNRTVVVRTGANYNAVSNSYEFFVDGRTSVDTAELNGIGDVALAEAKSTTEMTIKTNGMYELYYPTFYELGDRISVVVGSALETKTIVGITVSIGEDNTHDVALELE